MNKNLKIIKAFIFDLDGTLYLGNKTMDGAIELISFLKQKSKKTVFFTNNSNSSRNDVFNKLLKLGFDVLQKEVYTSSYVTAVYLNSQKISKAFVIGGEGLIQELKNKNIIISLESEASTEAVVVGLDTSFDYKKLVVSLNFLRKGAQLIASNLDANYPVENGLLPACGPIVRAIESAAQVKSNFIAGKPETYFLELMLYDLKLTKDEIVVIGDRYDSDIEMAKNMGCFSFLIGADRMEKDDVKRFESLLEFNAYLRSKI